MKKPTNKIEIIGYIIVTITIIATILLISSFATMIESWTVTAAPLTISIICGVWLGLIGVLLYIVEKN